MRRSARTALIAWAGLSLLVAASLLLIYLRLGSTGFEVFIQQPPLINLPVTLASVALLWLSAGALLYLLQAGHITAGNFISVSGFFIVLWAYLNVLSERWRYGDYTYYFESAATLFRNEPLHGSYFYPPLWATLTQFLVPAGEETFFIVLWLLDAISLIAFYFLLHRVLERYGFGSRLAAVVTTAFMLANAPLLRTLVYVQVNLHTMNLIFLALLLYPTRKFLSALLLALAMNLKGSPAVLVLAFLLEKDWRWLAWFAASAAAIAAITVLTDGISPFLEVLQHWQGLALSSNTIYHDTSFDSFLRSTARFAGVELVWARILAYAAKAALVAGSLMTMLRSARSLQFIKTRETGSQMLNAIPPLFVLMTLSAPVVWEHHGVFVVLSFLLMLKRLETAHEWLWFGFAYLLEFLLPTFDFYPWSFGRLVAPMIILWQMWRLAERKGDSPVFKQLNRWFEKLPALKLPA
jgi:hypothetical protein